MKPNIFKVKPKSETFEAFQWMGQHFDKWPNWLKKRALEEKCSLVSVGGLKINQFGVTVSFARHTDWIVKSSHSNVFEVYSDEVFSERYEVESDDI